MLIESYNHKIYDALKEVETVAECVTADEIAGIGKIIAKYGYYQTVAVALAHRHFDLSNDEAMLEVEKNPHEHVATPELLTKIASIGVYPTVIKYGDDGRWYPITYGREGNETAAWDDADFLRAVGQQLAVGGLSEKLVLTTIRKQKNSDDGDVFAEFNYDNRVSVTRLTKKSLLGDNFTTTVFEFNANGEIQTEGRCERVCIKNTSGGHSHGTHVRHP